LLETPRYEEGMSPRSQFFRANVGAVVCRHDGCVLAFERTDRPGAWQLPQGGLDEGEEPPEAVLREVQEETGIDRGQLELLCEHPELLAYELPADLRGAKTGRGQVQYWFYFGADAEPRLPADGEFGAWRWMELRDLAAEVVVFRRPTYKELVRYFERVVRPEL
jgi:putative (di)nucleoside polyphosphate hydrolase